MSLTARLHIEGHSNEQKGSTVLSCSYGFSQNVDETGRAISNIRGGTINISLRGVDDQEILQWMIGSNVLKNGKIVFSGITAMGPGRKIEFEDGYLINYHESFSDQSDIQIQLTISARKISVSGIDHMNQWSKDD